MLVARQPLESETDSLNKKAISSCDVLKSRLNELKALELMSKEETLRLRKNHVG